jgi:uncharacterized protein YfiM (DUF2279 family)
MFKRIITILVLMPIINSVHAEEWMTKEKEFNIMASGTIASIATYYSKDKTTGFVYAAGAGLAKEMYDANGRGQLSVKDLTATTLGAYIGSQVTGLYITPNIKKDASITSFNSLNKNIFDGFTVSYVARF